VTHVGSHAWDTPGQRGTSARRRVRQVAWGAVPLVSLTLLAFVPFLWLALIRRRARDWAVFAAYLAAVVAELVLLSGKSGSLTSAIGAVLILVVWGTATIHALIAFRPGAAVPSWRDVHTLRTADKREKLAAAAIKEREVHDRASAVRAATADKEKAQSADRAAARVASAEAAQEQKREEAAQKAAMHEQERARRAAASAASAEAAQRRKRENAAERAAMADQKEAQQAATRAVRAEKEQTRKREKAAQKAARKAEKREQREAARAAALAAPRYGWVETRRTYRSKTIFGNRRSETVVSLPSQRNARRRTRQRFGVTITEEWRRLD
jgi:hypothetical protein